MTRIHVVTDSTADIAPEVATATGLTVIPLIVRFGDEQFRDGEDIRAGTFYSRLAGGESPATSQPAPQVFAAVYRELLRDPMDSIISIHLAAKLSGTVQSALLAARDVADDRIHVVDSGTVSGGIHLLIRDVQTDIAAGAPVDVVVDRLRARAARVGIYVLLDTLTYLHRGGRIGRAQSFLGGLLHVRPILHLADGEVLPQMRVRSRGQGIDAIVDLVRDRGALDGLGVMHAAAPELRDQMTARLRATHEGIGIVSGEIGPVVGTYAGPGALGVAYLKSGE